MNRGNCMQSLNVDLVNRKVVQANDLITSVAKMDRIPLQIFELAVAQINVENPPSDNTIFLDKKTLFSFFDVSSENKHFRFKQAIENMQKQAFFLIQEQDTKRKSGFTYKSIVPIPAVEWNDYDDEVKIRFDVDIMPFLIDLKTNFTQYLISDIMNLKSKYSVIIYKWLSMNYNQFEHYQHTSTRTEKQLNDYENPKIKIDELRRITDTLNEYERFQSLEKRVISRAIEEINEHTHFDVTYQKIKSGRYISEIQFFITKKQVAKNEFYKEEQQDKSYIEQQQQDETDIISAIRHSYTTKLLEHKLLEFADVLNDKNTMLVLYRTVYDKYYELDAEQKLDKHLSYVKAHMKDYSKRNIADYLRISVEQYLAELKYLEANKNDNPYL